MRGEHAAQRRLRIRLPRQHQPHGVRLQLAHAREQTGAVDDRHAHVGHDYVEFRALDLGQARRTTQREHHVPLAPLRSQHRAQPLQDGVLVVDEQHALLACGGRDRIRAWFWLEATRLHVGGRHYPERPALAGLKGCAEGQRASAKSLGGAVAELLGARSKYSIAPPTADTPTPLPAKKAVVRDMPESLLAASAKIAVPSSAMPVPSVTKVAALTPGGRGLIKTIGGGAFGSSFG